MIKRLDLELQEGETKPPDLTDENHRLKEMLVGIIKGIDALTEDLPMEKISSLRQQIRFVLRQQQDHEMARIGDFFEVNHDQLGF